MQRQQEKESHLGLVADLGGGGRGGPSQGLRRLWSSSGNRGTLQGSSSGSRGQSGRGAERHPLPAPGRQSHSPAPGGGHRPGGAAGGGQGRPVAGMGAVRLSLLGEDAPRPCASPHAQRLCIQLGLRALWGGGHSHVHAAEGRGSSQAGPGQARAAKPGSAWKNTNPNLPLPNTEIPGRGGFPPKHKMGHRSCFWISKEQGHPEARRHRRPWCGTSSARLKQPQLGHWAEPRCGTRLAQSAARPSPEVSEVSAVQDQASAGAHEQPG